MIRDLEGDLEGTEIGLDKMELEDLENTKYLTEVNFEYQRRQRVKIERSIKENVT